MNLRTTLAMVAMFATITLLLGVIIGLTWDHPGNVDDNPEEDPETPEYSESISDDELKLVAEDLLEEWGEPLSSTTIYAYGLKPTKVFEHPTVWDCGSKNWWIVNGMVYVYNTVTQIAESGESYPGRVVFGLCDGNWMLSEISILPYPDEWYPLYLNREHSVEIGKATLWERDHEDALGDYISLYELNGYSNSYVGPLYVFTSSGGSVNWIHIEDTHRDNAWDLSFPVDHNKFFDAKVWTVGSTYSTYIGCTIVNSFHEWGEIFFKKDSLRDLGIIV